MSKQDLCVQSSVYISVGARALFCMKYQTFIENKNTRRVQTNQPQTKGARLKGSEYVCEKDSTHLK